MKIFETKKEACKELCQNIKFYDTSYVSWMWYFIKEMLLVSFIKHRVINGYSSQKEILWPLSRRVKRNKKKLFPLLIGVTGKEL